MKFVEKHLLMEIGSVTPIIEQKDAGCRIYKLYESLNQEEVVKRLEFAPNAYVQVKQSLPEKNFPSSRHKILNKAGSLT